MKNLMRFFVFVVAAGLWLGCTDDDNQVTANLAAEAAVVQANATDIDLLATQSLPGNPALTVSWSPADYNVQSVVNYEVQISSTANFENYIVAATTTDNAFTATVNELNIFAQQAGMPVEVATPMHIRVGSFLGTQNTNLDFSNVIAVNVTPFFSYIFKDYFLVGAATEPGWNNNSNNPPLFRSEEDPNSYSYTGFFRQEQFKVLEFLGQWQPQWGTNDGSTLSGNPATQGNDPGEFVITGADGFYTVNFNFVTRVFEVIPFTGSLTENSSMVLSGSASGGSAITLTQSGFDPHLWSALGVNLSTGSVTFQSGSGTTWGGNNEFHGRAQVGGPEIPVTERTYNVWFSDIEGDYMLIPQN